MLTVADELAFGALEDETRNLCEKIIDARIDDEADARVKSWKADYKEEKQAELDEAERENVKLSGVIKALEDQLRFHGVLPDQRFGAPPVQTVDASLFEAKPRKKRGKEGDDFVRPMGATPRE